MKIINIGLSNVKSGDWIYTIKAGWEYVKGIEPGLSYPVHLQSGGYAFDGKFFDTHLHPSAWVDPPAYLNAPPKPLYL
jgi:hypothetical protein